MSLINIRGSQLRENVAVNSSSVLFVQTVNRNTPLCKLATNERPRRCMKICLPSVEKAEDSAQTHWLSIFDDEVKAVLNTYSSY